MIRDYNTNISCEECDHLDFCKFASDIEVIRHIERKINGLNANIEVEINIGCDNFMEIGK